MTDLEDEARDLPKSKSRVKRDMLELQALGERLVDLNNAQLTKLNLPSQLHGAIIETRKITSRSAKRRQLQYIGRLMREIPNPAQIREFFEQLEMKDQRSAAFHHMLESWRERLLSDDKNEMTEFLKQYPSADRQHLRQLISNARKERVLGKPAGAGKLLFRYLKSLHQGAEKDEVGIG